MSLRIDLAFFQEDDLLARGSIICVREETEYSLVAESGHEFNITSRFEEPACPVEITCLRDNKELYRAALRVGVHTSDDWELVTADVRKQNDSQSRQHF